MGLPLGDTFDHVGAETVELQQRVPLRARAVSKDALTIMLQAVEQFEQTAEQMIATYRERTAGLPMTERSFYDLDVIV